MKIIRTSEEINEQLDKANQGIEKGTSYSGMSFEEGVKAAIDWILGYCDDIPIE